MGNSIPHKPASLSRFERQDSAAVRLEESRQEVAYFLSQIRLSKQMKKDD